MAYDRRKEFEEIDEMLNAVRIACNRARIPFIWVAAVADSGTDTEYRVAIDDNSKKNAMGRRDSRYICNTLTPGSMELSLQDDKIKEILKILNGFRAVPRNNPIYMDTEDFSMSNILSGEKSIYRPDGQGGFVMPVDLESDDSNDIYSADELRNVEDGPSAFVLDKFQFDTLPRIEDDYEAD